MSSGHGSLLDRADWAIAESKALAQETRQVLARARHRAAALRISGAKFRADIDIARHDLTRILHAPALERSETMETIDAPRAETRPTRTEGPNGNPPGLPAR